MRPNSQINKSNRRRTLILIKIKRHTYSLKILNQIKHLTAQNSGRETNIQIIFFGELISSLINSSSKKNHVTIKKKKTDDKCKQNLHIKITPQKKIVITFSRYLQVFFTL
jgi:hypothetical protein